MLLAAHDRTTQVANEFNRVNRDAEALRARVQKDQELHDGVFRDLAEQQEQQVRNPHCTLHQPCVIRAVTLADRPARSCSRVEHEANDSAPDRA